MLLKASRKKGRKKELISKADVLTKRGYLTYVCTYTSIPYSEGYDLRRKKEKEFSSSRERETE